MLLWDGGKEGDNMGIKDLFKRKRDEQTKQVEEIKEQEIDPTKMNIRQKATIKGILWKTKREARKAQKAQRKAIKGDERDIKRADKYKEKLKKCLNELNEIFEFENDNGTIMTSADIEILKLDQMVEMLTSALEEFEKMV